MTDPNLTFLSVVHNLKSSSADAQLALELAIANSTGGSVKISTEGARALIMMLSLQNQMISGLVEQNAQIVEKVEELIARAEKK